ncbi:MAG: putative lipid II flippase FtsW [Acidobacteriota bacterium]
MVKNIGIDRVLITITLLLVLLGLIMVYSSTMILAKEKYGDSLFFLKRQLLWFIVGIFIFAILASIKKPFYLERKYVFLGITLAVLSLIAVFFVGKINYSYRWIKFGNFSVQPSEFAKIAVVLYLAYSLSRKKGDINDLKKLGFILTPVIIVELLILREPDLGNFALIFAITIVILFIAGLKVRYLISAFIFLMPFFILIIKMNPEKMNRIFAFLNPEAYSSTYGFQSLQSIYAIGSGGIFGQGLGNSVQKLFFLPYAYSDFIFSVIGEELGLIGTLLIIGLFFIYLVRGLNIAKLSGNRYTYLLVTGLTFLIVFQAMINISVTIGLFPTKGIPLPFISNGGSSLVSSLIITGIILNISRHRKTVLLND